METDLRDAFFAGVKAFGDANGLPVAYPNVTHLPPEDENSYLELRVFPTTPTVLTGCGGISQHIWILQISVMVRRDTGETPATDIVDLLRPAFPVSYQFIGGAHTFDVFTPPAPTPPIPISGWYSTPVQFRVQTFK